MPGHTRPVPRMPRLLLVLLLLLLSGRATAEFYLIGAEDDWYPFTGLRDGRIEGLSVDIVRAAFAASQTPVELVAYPYSRCMQMTLSGKLAACFNTAPNPQIARDYLLPQHALFSDDILLWARHDRARPLQQLEQIRAQRVAVTIGYEYGSLFDGYAPLVRVPVRQDRYGFLMLQRGRVDYTVAYRGTAQQLFRDYPELAGQFTPVLTVHQPQLYLSFSRHHPQAALLRERFDLGMQRIAQNGEYRRILARWQTHATAAQ